jgi:hypothetical protein
LDILSNIFEKSKYIDLFLSLHKDRYEKNMDQELEFDRYFIENGYESVLRITEFSHYDKFLIYRILSNWNSDEIRLINKFKELNERNLIEQNDVTKYKSFYELENQVSLSELKLVDKEIEKQVIKIYEDETWLILKPLSWEASKKYGTNSKWCTTSEGNPDYFLRYASNGVLIYILDKKTGYKIACHNNESEGLSFWDQKDIRVDSMTTLLTEDIRTFLSKHFIDEKMKPNLDYLSEEDRKIMERRYEFKFEEPYPSIGDIQIYEPSVENVELDIVYCGITTGTEVLTIHPVTTGTEVITASNTCITTSNTQIFTMTDNVIPLNTANSFNIRG